MPSSRPRRALAAATVLAAALVSAACSGDDATSETAADDAAAANGGSAASAAAKQAAAKPAVPEDPSVVKALVGPGCADYAKALAGNAESVAGLAKKPVTAATENSPMLTTITAAVSGKVNPDVNLVETFTSGQNLTLFTPVDTAFARLPAGTLDKLKTDADLMTDVLTYHVVNGQLTSKTAAGKHQTVQGAMLDVTGSGAAMKVNGQPVLCGGIKTANATIYLLDGVLMPPSAK